MINGFLSCDWGTSSFRLRLADTANFTIIEEEISEQGCAAIFHQWKETGSDNEKRILFYLQTVKKHLAKMEGRIGSLQGIPLIISGMASSSIGMIELPYHHVHFAIDGSDTHTYLIKANKDFDHDTLLISGVKTNNDVMRGEETQLIGCITSEMNNDDEKIFIFPGTHSKHILVKNKKIIDFKTYMTGEFFELLSQKSILRTSVEKSNNPTGELKSFSRGVRDSIGANLLHASFMVRTNDLFQVLKKEDNYHYLSGLLIGTELQDIRQTTIGEIFLCCGSNLRIFYEEAFHVLGLLHKTKIFPPDSANTAVIRGQWQIFKQKT